VKFVIYCYLSQEDLSRARRLAEVRNSCKSHGVNHRWRRERDDLATHELGALGELAVAQLLGGMVDEAGRPGGDDGAPDVVLPDGKGVSVKVRAGRYWDFLLDPGQKELGADYGVLCWTVGGILTLQIAGWCTDEDVRQHGVVKDYGHGRRLALAPGHLRPIMELVALYARRPEA